MATAKSSEILEEGDIFFFYRPRVEIEEVHGRGEVQRFYLVLSAERPRRRYRLFILGRKKLPQVIRGAQHAERRNWALCIRSSNKPEDIHRELIAVEYPTTTRGERFVAAATPVGEGKYQLFRHGSHTELAYALELPKEPGPAQEEFEIEKEASYVVAVKNPDVSTPGAPSSAPPAYPKRLRDRFGARRWIAVDDPELLDYENVQILLLGAHAGAIEEELGIEIDEDDETLGSADVCRDLRTRCDRERVKPFLTGEFPEREEEREEAEREEVHRLAPDEVPTRARKRAGRKAARRAPSAAAITTLLAGIDFPNRRRDLVEYARTHGDRIDNLDEAVQVLAQLPDRNYESMADVASGLGEVR